MSETKSQKTLKGKEWKETGELFPKMDYTPQVEEIRMVTAEIYEQTVDFLDLGAVIRAVNESNKKPRRRIDNN